MALQLSPCDVEGLLGQPDANLKTLELRASRDPTQIGVLLWQPLLSSFRLLGDSWPEVEQVFLHSSFLQESFFWPTNTERQAG